MISFSRIVKEEIVFNDFDQECEKAILCAMIKIIGTLSLNQSGLSLTLRTENAKIASKLHKFLKDLYQPHIEFRVSRKMKLKKNNIYILKVSKAREILENLHLMEGIGIQSFPDIRFLETDTKKRAYLAGVFLSCGSVNNPDTSNYHLEMSVNEPEYASFIKNQWKGLGLSLDYTKERFTLDDGMKEAVNYVFISLYNKGYIYQGERIINWDPEAKTALSNIEVVHQDDKGALYYIYYLTVDGKDKLLIATTRPETMFADQALMVNPTDERYINLIGKEVYIPTTNVKIPVISDSYVDKEFGSGIVKVTPAHDPNDFEVGKRHHCS